MRSAAAAEVLLVQAVEEIAPERIDPEAVLDAELAAGPIADPATWFAERAAHVLPALPPAVRTLPAMTGALSGGLGKLLAASALLGVLTNYLGPSQRIHVVYNPIVLLVLWNLGVYALLAVGRSGLRGLRAPRRSSPAPEAPSAPEPVESPESLSVRPPGLLARWIFGWGVPRLWTVTLRRAAETREEARELLRIAQTFWSRWVDLARPLFGAAARRALHVGALGLALGAVLGMFVRGLFLDYHVVWRSTFVTEPQTVERVLHGLFALPAWLAGQPLPGGDAPAALLGPAGVPARPWIWIYAAAAGLFIVLPRALLLAAATRRLHTLGASLELDLETDYFRAILARARAQRIDQIEGAIRTEVRVETGRFAAGIAAWVCERLYDGRIVPQLHRFREEGGRLLELEAAIAAECEAFQTELDTYFPRAQAQFAESLQRAVASAVEAEVRFDASAGDGLKHEVGGRSRDATAGIGESMGRDLNRALGSAISGAVALAIGTLSGGFGKTVGLALIATLLGTSGPVGFLIGALAALVAAGGVYVLGERRATRAIQSLRLPAAVARTLLWPKRLERLIDGGRARCRDSVEALIQEKLEPLTPRISDEIWRQVRPAIARSRRAAPPASQR